MQFLDEVVIFVFSGKGGDGHVSFRREKYVPRGGPDGGDGGDGGGVVFEASPQKNTLIDFRRQRFFRADDGVPGGKKQMYGANGPDLVCFVPLGTVIYDEQTGEQLADLPNLGDRYRVPGGKGGLGNMHFKSSTNRTPRQSTPGDPGLELELRLELKLLADVGLLGFPNAGKSTFLGRVSAAKPRVADYPFTTLVPQLGVVHLDDETSFVIADIPGLIEGAAEGAGLGHRFLKHVERCAGYLHLVSADPYEAPPVTKLRALNQELRKYGAGLYARPQVVALTKIDLLTPEEIARHVEALSEATGARVFPVSAITGEGMTEMILAVAELVRSHDPADLFEE